MNSNVPASVFEELKNELDSVNGKMGSVDGGGVGGGGGDSDASSTGGGGSKRRGKYAAMDISSMGVDVDRGPRTELVSKKEMEMFVAIKISRFFQDDNKLAEEKARKQRLNDDVAAVAMVAAAAAEVEGGGGEKESDKLEESAKEKAEKSDGEEDTRQEEAEEPAPVVRRRSKKRRDNNRQQQQQQQQLPSGWERHEDELGPYYWHVKSGTIQRDPPAGDSAEGDAAAVVRDVRSSNIFDEDFDPLAVAAAVAATSPSTAASSSSSSAKPSMSKSCTTASISEMAKGVDKQQQQLHSRQQQQQHRQSSPGGGEWKRRSMPPKTESLGDEHPSSSSTTPSGSGGNLNSRTPMRVQVQSLGCLELREDELTPENSSKAVNRCIVQLSPVADEATAATTAEETPAAAAAALFSSSSSRQQWGGGRALTLELNEGSLKLVCPKSGGVLNSQPIHSIRVWGVGRDNGRDFAYVARDKHTRKHLCHVFR